MTSPMYEDPTPAELEAAGYTVCDLIEAFIGEDRDAADAAWRAMPPERQVTVLGVALGMLTSALEDKARQWETTPAHALASLRRSVGTR